MINKFSKPIIILLLLLIPATKFLFTPHEYWNMHDDMQLVRQMEMEKCLYDGQIPCRWVPDLGYGYGYPLFNFYPPMPYYVGQIFRTFGFTYTTTIKLTSAVQFISSALAMYLLASSLFGPIGGLISSIFYTYAPYHAVNIYVRGAMNEAWASVFFPLIFYFTRQLILKNDKKYFIGLSLSLSGLMLSHNPMLLIFSPVLVVWGLFWLYQLKFKKISYYYPIVLRLGLSAVLGFLLSSFYTIPVLLEGKFVQIDSMFTNYYSWSVHFVSLKQLFISNFWGDGPSVWGPKDGFSTSVGYFHWILPLIIFFSLFIKFIKNKKLNQTEQVFVLTAILGLFTIYLSHEKSTFIWKTFSTLQKIQFPWRFLNLSTFLTSLSVGFVSLHLSNSKYKMLTISCLMTILLISSLPFFTPISHGPITDTQKFSGLAWTNQVTGGIYDYLPKTASTAAKGPAKEYIDEIIPSNTKYQLTGAKKGTDWRLFNIKLDNSATIYLSQLNFPNFKVNVNGKEFTPDTEPYLGRISLKLNSGDNQIYLKLYNTPVRNLSNILSVISFITIIGLALKWKQST